MKNICKFKRFGAFIECASNPVPTVATLKEFAQILARTGYNTLYLGTADTYEMEGEPYFGYNRGRYTKAEINELDNFCKGLGIELCPAIQTLAHLHFVPNYVCYQNLIDTQHIMLVDEEKTYVFIDKMFKTMSEFYTSRTINIGMDEAFALGLGKYLEKHGYTPRLELMLRHLEKVAALAKKYGFDCEMWSDMFCRHLKEAPPEDMKKRIPENVSLINWNYLKASYDDIYNITQKHKCMTDKTGYAGGLWKWFGFAPDNWYSIEMCANAMDACIACGLDNFMVTMWADNGGDASLFSILPSLYFYAEYAHGRATNLQDLDRNKFFELFNVDFDAFMLLDKLNKPHDKEYSGLNNKSYFYLYNDLLLGNLDSLLSENIGKAYAEVGRELKSINADRYQYLFTPLAILADILAKKAELSKWLRAAYIDKNIGELTRLLREDLLPLSQLVQQFYDSLKVQWNRENKSFGFEVHCQRMGGLMARFAYVAEVIDGYICGRIDKIDEFEIEHLPHNYAENINEDNYIYLDWKGCITHGFI